MTRSVKSESVRGQPVWRTVNIWADLRGWSTKKYLSIVYSVTSFCISFIIWLCKMTLIYITFTLRLIIHNTTANSLFETWSFVMEKVAIKNLGYNPSLWWTRANSKCVFLHKQIWKIKYYCRCKNRNIEIKQVCPSFKQILNNTRVQVSLFVLEYLIHDSGFNRQAAKCALPLVSPTQPNNLMENAKYNADLVVQCLQLDNLITQQASCVPSSPDPRRLADLLFA